MLDKGLIETELSRLHCPPLSLFVYSETDSTNTRAREYARINPKPRKPAVFVADSQTAGRGRRGRSFFSESGVGIYMTLLIYPDEHGYEATRLTARAAVALSDAIFTLTGTSPEIKWVNDLYLGGKKLAGILTECEMSVNGEIACLVLGMGINVYKTSFPEEISDIATSIEAELNTRISRERLIAEVTKNLLSQTEDEGEILEKYRSLSLVIGKEITVLPLGGEAYAARAVEILDDYSLSVQLPDGRRERIFSGEVSTKIKRNRK